MKTLTIQIKNMVCPRCIHVVKQILSESGIHYSEVGQGYALLVSDPFPDLEQLNFRLEELGLGLVKDQNELLISEIINTVHDYISELSSLSEDIKLSSFLACKLARNYHQLSKLFSKYQGVTIEQFFIKLRVEKVKELIRQGKLNYSQIAISLGYSSIQYLSGQFKKVVGMTLSEYQKEWDRELVRLTKEESRIEGLTFCECSCEDCACEDDEGKNGSEKNGQRSFMGVAVSGQLRLIDAVREFKVGPVLQ